MHSTLQKKRLHTQAHTETPNTPQLKNNPFLDANAQPQTNPFLANAQVAQQKAVAQMGGGNKKGVFIGQESGCHIHIVGDNDHFKVGNDKGSRIDLRTKGGSTYILSDLQNCLTEIKSEHVGKPGYEACVSWLREQAINHPEAKRRK